MYAMQNEMGETLEKTLKLFRKSPHCVEDLISYEVPYDLLKEKIFELVKRGYLANVDDKEYHSFKDVSIEDKFRITIKGTDYLEIRSHWWEIFSIESFYLPIVVSFITSIISEFIKPPLFTALSKVLLYLLDTTY